MARPLRLLVAVALVVGSLRAAAAATSPEDAARAGRVLALLRGIGSEYHDAFDERGTLTRPIELEEARLLLAEATDLAPRLGLAGDALAPLAQALAGQAPPDAVDAALATLAASVTRATGVREDTAPPTPPSIERGAGVFRENCAGCHGADGRGDGAEAARLGIRPANFTDRAFLRGETPDDFFNVVTLGRRRSGMPAWGEALSVQERWDAVRFVWSLGADAETVAAGRARWGVACAGCHAAGVGDAGTLAGRTDGELAAAIGDPRIGAHVGLAGLDETARRQVVAWIRARSFDGIASGTPGAAAPAASPRERLAAMHDLLDAALAAERRGDAGAGGLATDAYMRFEPFERRLGATHPEIVRTIEEGFVRLRQALRAAPPDDAAVAALVATLHRDVDDAIAALEPGGADAWVRFVQSATIILREGFEVVLVVGALVTYVQRSGVAGMVRSLYLGAALGVAASIATAIVLATVLRLTPWAGEALEGAALLLAAAVLFWVSYWLVSKAEADRWQRYIRSRVEDAMAAGRGTALAAAAFLAVYREGFETILFYQALFASAPAGDVMVPAGLAAGAALLALVWAGLSRVGVRIPVRPFFFATGGFLYAMAIVFAGRGVAELQEAGLVSLTPVGRVPRVDVLGVFPTVETLAAQALFLALLAYAVTVTVRRRARGAAAARPARRAAQG